MLWNLTGFIYIWSLVSIIVCSESLLPCHGNIAFVFIVPSLFGKVSCIFVSWFNRTKLRNEVYRNLNSSRASVWMITSRRRLTECVAVFQEMINAYRPLVGKYKWKRPLGRPMHRWVDNIKMCLRDVLGVRVWTTFKWFKIRSHGISCELGSVH
jgi:hypothetical protein